MATHSSVLAWRIPGMAEPGGLWAVGCGVAQSRTRLKRLSSSSSSGCGAQNTGSRAHRLQYLQQVSSVVMAHGLLSS